MPLLTEFCSDSNSGGASPPASSATTGSLEKEELGKIRFMELLSNCGVYQKVSELILRECATFVSSGQKHVPSPVPQVRVDGLDDFLEAIEELVPALRQARDEIRDTASVSFYPGLGEHFIPGSKLACSPTGMEGTLLGCQVVQCWYDQQESPASSPGDKAIKVKRRFILVVEFVVSVGDELVFVAASDVYPEFANPSRSAPVRDLAHRKFNDGAPPDRALLSRLQQRGEFYASIATRKHYLEYHPNRLFPIIGGG